MSASLHLGVLRFLCAGSTHQLLHRVKGAVAQFFHSVEDRVPLFVCNGVVLACGPHEPAQGHHILREFGEREVLRAAVFPAADFLAAFLISLPSPNGM